MTAVDIICSSVMNNFIIDWNRHTISPVSASSKIYASDTSNHLKMILPNYNWN